MYMWSFVIFKFPVSNSCRMLAGHQVLPGTNNYYSHAFRNSALMILQKMLPLLFFHELNWVEFLSFKMTMLLLLWMQWSTLTTMKKKSFYCWNVARNSSKTSLKYVNDTWRVLLGSPIRSPSSCSKGGYHEPLDGWIVFGGIYSLDSCIHALNNWAQVGQRVWPRQHVILWPSSWQA